MTTLTSCGTMYAHSRYSLLFIAIIFLMNISVKGKNTIPLSTKVSSINQLWTDFKHEEGAFSVKLPTKPEYQLTTVVNPVDSTGPGYKLHLFISTDEVNKAQYLVRYNDYPPGMFLVDKSLVFDATVKDLAGKGEIFYGPEPVKTDDYDGLELRLMLGNKYTICRMFIRGNRFYLLLKQNMLERIRVTMPDDFFSSFKLEPFQTPALISYKPENENFKIQLFNTPNVTSETITDPESFLEKSTSHSFANPNSGGAYIFEHYYIRNYYRLNNLDTIYHNFQKNLTADSLISEKTVVINGLKVKDFVSKGAKSDNITRNRIWIDEGKMFFMRSFTVQEEAFSSYSNTFFDSFKKIGRSIPVDLSLSKAQKIFEDAASSDTTIRKNAIGAFSYYEFSEDELPAIYSALQQPFADDTTNYGTRVRLLESLISINSSGSVPKLKELYSSIKGLDELKENILYTIKSIKSGDSNSTYLDLLINEPLVNIKSLSWKTFSGLTDSLPFAAANFDKLKPLFSNQAYRSEILALSNLLLTSKDSLHKDLIIRNSDYLMSRATEDVNKFISNEQESNVDINTYMHILKELPLNLITDEITKQLIKDKADHWCSTRAAALRITKGLETDDTFLLSKMDSIYSRYLIMEALSDTKQLNRIPQKYKQPEEFGKLCLYEFITDYETDPEKIELLGKISEKDSIYYVYNILHGEEDSVNQYIGISGPHKPGNNKLDFDKYNAYTNWDIKLEDWETQAREIIAKDYSVSD